MKLDLQTLGFAVVAAAFATACARPIPASTPVSTTELTSAEPLSSATAEPAPKVGKSQRALDADEQDALEPKLVRKNEGSVRKSGAFGNWK